MTRLARSAFASEPKTAIDGRLPATNAMVFTNGLLAAHTNALGLVTRYNWDGLERLNWVSFPDSTTNIYSYQKLDLNAFQDRLGRTTAFGYNPLGQLTNVVDALARQTKITYCACGSPDTVTDPLNASTTHNYDYNGRLLSEQDSDGFVRTYHRNGIGQVTNVTDSAGNNLFIAYNHGGLVNRVSNPTGTLYQVTYDIHDRPAFVTNAYGAATLTTYDHLNRPLTRTLVNAGISSTETFAYSTNGLVSRTDAESRVTTYGYDAAGRLSRITNANHEVVSATFNPVGRMLSLTDGRNKTTRWAYDLYGRTIAETNANSVLARTNGYDANGQLIRSWTPAKGLALFAYDPVGNLTNIVSSNRTVAVKYDGLDRATNVVDAGGTVARSYVKFGAFQGALATEDGPWANDTYTIHRQSDRLADYATLQELDGSGTATTRLWTFNYDALNRLNQLGGSAGSFTFDYAGAAGRLLTTHLPGGNVITNWMDPAGQLLGRWLKNSGGTALDAYVYTHDRTGLRTNVVRGDGTHVEFDFDGIGQLTNAVAYESGGTLRKNENFQYAYDAAGNLLTRTNHTLTQTFSVDNANRLSSAGRSGTLTVAGTANSLVQTVTVNNQGTALYGDKTFATTSGLTLSTTNTFTFIATDNASHSTTNTQTYVLPATVNYTYDLNGNLTSDGSTGYEYDDADRLTRITATNQWKSEFVYDALGRRNVRREYVWQGGSWSLSDEVRYVWLGMSLVQERDAVNKVRVTYTGKLAREDALGAAFYFTDGNGNVSSLIDASGNNKAKYRYDSFGNLVSKSGSLADANLIRFSGKEYHAQSGLYYYGFRHYAPNLQRWMNQDPIGIRGGMNLYGFVGNNPINYADADGRIYGELLAGVGSLLGNLADSTSSPGVGAAASLMGDIANNLASTDPTYAGYQDLQSLAQNGPSEFARQKYEQLEEGVGTADWVRARDYGDEYSDLEQVIYGASGLAKSAFCVMGARGLAGKGVAGETAASEAGSGTSSAPAGKAVAPAKPECPAKPTANTKVVNSPEQIAPQPIKPENVLADWDNFLGPEPHNNIHPRTGLPDPNRIVSADGTKSIRYGPHEMNSSPTKQHYHRETWNYDSATDTMKVDNTLVRMPH